MLIMTLGIEFDFIWIYLLGLPKVMRFGGPLIINIE